jgi:hypothetical protein
MKHPTPSDFIVKVEESHVSVIFKPSNSDYYFGRLVDSRVGGRKLRREFRARP